MLLTLFIPLVLAAGALYQAVGAQRNARTHPPPGMLVDAGGYHLHAVMTDGDAPAVLFEAGIASSSLSWTLVQRDVAAFARTCAYDRAGLAWSGRAPSPRTVDQMIGELRRVLHATAQPLPAVLTGHSFGAFLVLLYAARHPEDVAGLVLLDPPSEWHDAGPTEERLLWGGIWLSRIGAALARVGIVRGSLALLSGGAPGIPRRGVRVFGARAASTLEHLVGEVRKLPPDVHSAVQEHWSQPKCFRALAEHLALLREVAAGVAGVTSLGPLPMVVVSSGRQPPPVIEKHRQLAGLSTRGRHAVAARSGHWIQLDEPELVIATVRDVVDRARLSASDTARSSSS